jgi:membrane-bound ClpP family serine protease
VGGSGNVLPLTKRARTLLTVFLVLGDEIIIVLIVLFILWNLGVDLPLWALIPLVVGLGAFSVMLYKLVDPVLNKKQITGREGMIGREGKVVTPLAPEGVIKVRGELWKASSTEASISTDEEVIVVRLEGLKLLVRRKNGAEEGEGDLPPRNQSR